jgi:hypothetical protein
MENKFQTGSFLDFFKKGKIQKNQNGRRFVFRIQHNFGLFVLMPTRMKAEQYYPDLNSGGLNLYYFSTSSYASASLSEDFTAFAFVLFFL